MIKKTIAQDNSHNYSLTIQGVVYTGTIESLAKTHNLTPMQVIFQGKPIFVPNPSTNPEFFKVKAKPTKAVLLRRLKQKHKEIQSLLKQLELIPLPTYMEMLKHKK